MNNLTLAEKELAQIIAGILKVPFGQLFTDLEANELAIQEIEKMAETNLHFSFAFARPFLKNKLQQIQNTELTNSNNE
jgi:hypothetical protein